METTVDGAARLTQSLQRRGIGKGDVELGRIFLGELIKVGRYVRDWSDYLNWSSSTKAKRKAKAVLLADRQTLGV